LPLADTILMSPSSADARQLDLPEGFGAAPGARDYARLLQQVSKPPRGEGGGNDSCQWANDGECDEPGFGTGACPAGTDRSDCYRIMNGREDDSCQWANDGECDEPGFGTGACTQGTDRSDCGDVSHLRFQNDSCATAFNGICEAPGRGNGACAARTDRTDCSTRERPLTINDHFFGRDDRVMMDTGTFPWSVIGYVTFDEGGVCTATLVAPNVLATAAHCISEGRRISERGVFRTGEGLPGGARTARVVDFLVDPDWDEQRFSDSDDFDGTDWALLRLDQSLGDELGYVGVLDITELGSRNARAERLWQAGYSWDTGTNLSGNEACNIVELNRDNTMAHNCDTTRGDSGSPFMVRRGDQWAVVATDSNFRSNPDGPMIYIAALSSRWADQVDAFARGEIGRPRGPGKPDALMPIKK
jgi:protease YdgD